MKSHLLLSLFLLLSPLAQGEEVYLTVNEFVKQIFGNDPTKPQILWLQGRHQEVAQTILGHKYRALRLRYWQENQNTLWVLEKIGKEQPITIGVAIGENGIQAVRILTYRESRGGEVKYPFFTNQFLNARLQDNYHLDRHIDGITGATLSVSAVRKIASWALYLHQQVLFDEG